MKHKRKRTQKRCICLMAAVALLLQSNVQTAMAWPGTAPAAQTETTGTAWEPEEGYENTLDTEESDNVAETMAEPVILQEIAENRGEFSKEYLLSDNSHAVVMYSEQIHFENEDGELEEIDNSLVKTEEGYANANNSYDVLITDNEDSRGEVIYKEDAYEIAWQMVEFAEEETGSTAKDENAEAEPITEVVLEEIVEADLEAEVNDLEPETAEMEEELHQVKQSAITFDGYQSGVSVEYIPAADGIKENIILPTRESGNEYVFSVRLEGLEAKISSANEVEFYDAQTDELEYYFPAPFMIDSEGEISYKAKYSILGVTEEVCEEEVFEEETEYFGEYEDEESESTEESEELPPYETDEAESTEETVEEPENTAPETETVEESEDATSEAGTEEISDITTLKTALQAVPTMNIVGWTEEETTDEPMTTPTESEVTEEPATIPTETVEEPSEPESETSEKPEAEPMTETTEEPETTDEASAEDDTETTEEPETVEETDTTQEPETSEVPLTEEEIGEPLEETPLLIEDDTIYIKIELDEEWLDNASYPVTLDPVLKQARAKNLLDYGSVGDDGSKTDTLRVGRNSNGNIFRSYIRFDLPQMEKQSIVSEAMLYLDGTVNEENTHYITASRIDEEWHHKAEEAAGMELSWENQPKTAELLDYHVNGGYFNITKAVRKWMSGEIPNYGIAFKAYNEESKRCATLKLKDSKTSPYLKITYRTTVGLESYWGTHATGAGTAGAGYINDYTGALTVMNTDVVTAGNRFPMSIGHTYNSNATEKNGGWRLNYDQTIHIPTDTADITTYPYVYTDADGTEHYFKKKDVTYLLNGASKEAKASAALPSAQDEDGLKLYIVPVTDATLKATYPLKLINKSASTVSYFDKMGRLGMITDSNQYENGKNSETKEKNALTITYENYGSEASLAAFEEAITKATAFKALCADSVTKVGSEEYISARDALNTALDTLKKDSYVKADYATAKQVNTAALKMADITDTTASVSKSTAKTNATSVLTALEKAKTQAEALACESNKRIVSIADAVGNTAAFTYDENGRLHTISDPTYADMRVNIYSYDTEGNLTQIAFADGKNAYYTYGADHLLITQRDHDGYQVSYTYREPDKRIVKVEESHSGTPGQTYGITYNTDNTTTFRFSGVDDAYGTEDDIENIYVFDEKGRSICVYSKKVGEDKVLGASACTYEAESDSDVNKRNKIKDTAVVGMHTNNLLKNHSFEYNDKTWTTYKNVGETPESGALSAYNTTRKYIGDSAAYINLAKRKNGVAGFKQEAKLTAGTYTFSGYCKTAGIKNAAAYLKVTDADSNSYYSNKLTEVTNALFDNGWQRLEVTFSIPTDQTVTVCLETDCGTQTGAGNAAFDCVQLEAGNVANDYNILEDGSFELTEDVLPYRASKASSTSIKVADTREECGIDGDYCYHISGQPGINKYLRFNTKLGSAKNAFVLSGWFKTESTPVRKGRDIKVVAYHSEEVDGVTTTLKVEGDINTYSDGWKYFTLLVPAASWKDTTFTIRFYDAIGDLCIDGLQLTRNDVQTRKYNSEGKLTSVYTALKSSSSTHDSYDRLKTQTTPAGAKSTYTYSNNDVTKVAASIGPDSYMTYDKYGNQLTNSSYDPDATGKPTMYTENTYTEDGNFQKTSTDSAGNKTTYEYNTLTGQLEKTIMPAKGMLAGEEKVTVDYIYDEQDRISAVTQADRSISYRYGEFDDLTAITHNGFDYEYTYDKFGNVLTSSIAGEVICTNEYAPNNGSHITSIYPDGTQTGTTYDEYGKITSNSLDGNTITRYVYDNDGNIAKKTDAIANVTTKFDYNDSNMLVRSEVYDGDTTSSDALESRMQYTYTKSGQVGTLSYQEAGDDIRTYNYTYAADEKPVKSTLPDKSSTSWTYDSLRRNTKIIHTPKDGAADAKKLYTVLKYKDVELTTADDKTKKATTGRVQDYTNKFGSSGKSVSEFHYAYDGWGNITHIYSGEIPEGMELAYLAEGAVTVPSISGNLVRDTDDGGWYTTCGEEISNSTSIGPAIDVITGEPIGSQMPTLTLPRSSNDFGRHYSYNDFGEVTKARETYADGTTTEYTYTYDTGGNIVTETVDDTVHTYTYDSVWKDKLISYDGKGITYDIFGCPTDYMGSTMTWDIYGGLTSVDNGTDSITYTYMGDGQRRTKTVNGTTTTYHYNNGMLLSETTEDETLRYYYDSTGKVASLIHENKDGEETGYFYTRNAQGDIIGIYRSKDSKLIGTYEYDLWGRLISLTPTQDDTTGITEKNPYRYRSYYYDEETGFYYLNARYYDPQIRRFINADSMNALMIATINVGCKNLFAYAENNPITNKDSSGNFVESGFDLVTLVGSIAEVCVKPTDPWAWAGLAGDAIDLIPFATGVGEAVRVGKTAAKTAEMADTVSDAVKVADKVNDATKASSKVLRNNMVDAGIEVPKYANAAHHIVAGNATGAADARAVLDKFSININSAANGVFLPTEKGISNATYHPSLHTNQYYDKVNDLLGNATNQQEAIDTLKYIADSLKNGTFIK